MGLKGLELSWFLAGEATRIAVTPGRRWPGVDVSERQTGLRRLGTESSPDSPLEEDGFEPSVPGERAVVHGMDSPAQIIKPDRLTWPGSGGSSVPVQS
jgi:hypothetical protein